MIAEKQSTGQMILNGMLKLGNSYAGVDNCPTLNDSVGVLQVYRIEMKTKNTFLSDKMKSMVRKAWMMAQQHGS